MEKGLFKEGDIVRYRTLVSSIKKIENGKATLARGLEVDLKRLSQVKIGGRFDYVILLDCINPLRAPLVDYGSPVPLSMRFSYLENSIDGKSITSIIKENGFTVVPELQDWIAQNAPDFYLRTRTGI